MLIQFSPTLSDQDAELLEGELLDVAGELGIDDIDIAGCVTEGEETFDSLDLFYTDDQPDDEQLRGFAKEILGEFEDRRSGGDLSKDFQALEARVGKIQLKLG